MANLYETLSGAQQGEAIAGLGREFGLTPQQTQAAVESLLLAISMGLKQSTATPEGLGEQNDWKRSHHRFYSHGLLRRASLLKRNSVLVTVEEPCPIYWRPSRID